jgi:AraC-like DNA-binding protein
MTLAPLFTAGADPGRRALAKARGEPGRTAARGQGIALAHCAAMAVHRQSWMIPVPVRASRFVPLAREHARFNVETFPGGIGPFGAHDGRAPLSDVLYCDLQDNPDISFRGRLGSGRTGVYGGKYLKGVGRTPLAGNWADPEDLCHHTGHLRASSAVREYLISVYLEARGCGDAINRCEGVLLAPRAEALRGYLVGRDRERACGSGDGGANPWRSDLSLQALTVKPADFTRYSNLIWLANHLDFYRCRGEATTSFTRFLVELAHALDPTRPLDQTTPESIAAAFVRSVDRGLDALRRFWSLGISWGSLHNNFSVDGRFLDLEAPVVLGAPLLGIIEAEPRRELQLPHRATFSGFLEPLGFVLNMRMIAWHLRWRFEAIAKAGPPLSRGEREFAGDAARALCSGVRGTVLSSRSPARRPLEDLLLDWADGAMLPLARAERRGLRLAIGAACDAHLGGAPALLPLRPVATRLARVNTFVVPHLFDFLGPDHAVTVTEEARLVNDLIAALDQVGDLDELLAGLEDGARRIRMGAAHQPAVTRVGASAGHGGDAPGRARAVSHLHEPRACSPPAPPASFAREQALAGASAALATLVERAPVPPARSDPTAIRRARAYLLAHLTERVRLDELAAHVRMDKYHFVRLFSARVGLSPYAFLTQARIVRARELLRAGESVADVAAAVGFCDQSQLHRHFRRIVGVTPGQFVASLRQSPRARTSN